MKSKRIFWLGMHTVLVQTELVRLRSLGFEVYNPPYLSSVVDQSAVVDWSSNFLCTLPQEVSELLAKTNFFYDKIPVEVAEILNTFFELLVVTINPLWLHNILSVYNGAVVYRVFGQPYSLSQELINQGTFELISERESFWFCPHSSKVLDIEDAWIQERMRVIPYCVTDDVISLENTWSMSEDHQNMGLLCPRAIDIPYYVNNYKHLTYFFPDTSYKIFGRQIIPVDDPRVAGNLERNEYLRRQQELRGFVYHYEEPTVCYLPPIEFMIIGGPVVFMKGSLLARYFDDNSPPGMAKDINELVQIAKQVQDVSPGLVKEILDSQQKVAALYHPKTVWPIFDSTMREIVEGRAESTAPHFVRSLHSIESLIPKRQNKASESKDQAAVLVPFHQFGPAIVKHGKDYHCAEGIARVTRIIVGVLCASNYRVIITSRLADAGRMIGFFKETGMPEGSVQLLIVDKSNAIFPKLKSLFNRYLEKYVGNKGISQTKMGNSLKLILKLILTPVVAAVWVARSAYHRVCAIVRRLDFKLFLWVRKVLFSTYCKDVNSDPTIKCVIVPHYHLFPEVLGIRKPIALYLPDYLPHFYPKVVAMDSDWLYAITGKLLSKKANIIFTNSKYTQRYLPATILRVNPSKIVSFPLPFLNAASIGDKTDIHKLTLDNIPNLFVFYPTRNRPSKRLTDFIKTVNIVNERLKQRGHRDRLYGILTTACSPDLDEVIIEYKYFKFFIELSDGDLVSLYKRATALLFTSENEGNFPTQINEAFNLGIPVVATRIPLITEELGGLSDDLKLVEIGDCEGMADVVLEIIDDRESILGKQAEVRRFVVDNFSYELYAKNIINVVNQTRCEK